jgi:hypothetical protein
MVELEEDEEKTYHHCAAARQGKQKQKEGQGDRRPSDTPERVSYLFVLESLSSKGRMDNAELEESLGSQHESHG